MRAWAYFGMGVAQMSPLDNASTDARNANDYSYGDRGNVVNVENATDFRIEECDLIGTWTVIEVHNSSYGVVARNALGAGSHGCHGFISVDHVIFEHNRCVGLLQGARHYLKYAYHLWEGYNTNRISWGGSREAMTYDNPGDSFLGRFEAQRALRGGRALVRLAGNFTRFDDARDGRQHALVVVDGAGALQRRLVLALAGAAGEAAAGEAATFELDAPFEAGAGALAAGDLVAVLVYKGETLHVRNTVEDSGSFQFFDGCVDCVAAENAFRRMGPVTTWGQWHAPSGFIGPDVIATLAHRVQWLRLSLIHI